MFYILRLNLFTFLIILSINGLYSQSIDNSMNVQVLEYKDDSIPKVDYRKNNTLYTGQDTILTSCIDSLATGINCIAILYYKNGNLIKSVGFYGSKDSMYVRYYNNGYLCGNVIEWYENGQKLSDYKYINDAAFPEGKEWYKNGQLKSRREYNGEKGIYEEWYKNGQKKSQSDIGKEMGEILSYFKEWCANGYLIEHTKINQGKQKYIRYNCDSVKIGEGTMIDATFFWVGKKTEWFANGVKALEWNFKNGKTVEEANIKHGSWKYWNKNGELLKEEIYRNNKLVKEIFHAPSIDLE